MAPPGFSLKRRQTGIFSADRNTAVALREAISTYRSNLHEKTNDPEEDCQLFDDTTSKNLRTALKAFNSSRFVVDDTVVENLIRLFELLSKLYQRNVDASTQPTIQSRQQQQQPFNGLYGSVKCTLNFSHSKYGSARQVALHLESLGRTLRVPDESELKSIPSAELFDTITYLCHEIVAFCTRLVSEIHEKEDAKAISNLDWPNAIGEHYRKLEELKKQSLAKTFKYGSNNYKAVLRWLLPTDPLDTYRDVLSRRRGTETGGWLLENAKFTDWLSNADKTLWCSGIAGAGKTMIATIVMEHLINLHEKSTENIGVACVYLSHKEPQHLGNLLLSIIRQLTQRRRAISEELINTYEDCEDGKSRPGTGKIIEALQYEVDSFEETFIVVDALDECSDGVRFALLDELEKFKLKVHLLVTSRFLDIIADRLENSVKLEISAQPQDIKAFIRAQIDEPENYRLQRMTKSDSKLQKKIEDTVIATAKGMFLLARLHTESLTDALTPFEVTKALKTLPKTVDETYKLALERIDNQPIEGHRSFSRKVICWVAYSFRPLTVDELLFALAVDPGDRKFQISKVSLVEDVTSLCAGLVIIDQDSNVVRLVHPTMQTYFDAQDFRNDSRFKETVEKMADICLTCISFGVTRHELVDDDSSSGSHDEVRLHSDNDADDFSEDDGVSRKHIVKVLPTMSGYNSDNSNRSPTQPSTPQQALVTFNAPTLDNKGNSPRSLSRSTTRPGEVSDTDDNLAEADPPRYRYNRKFTRRYRDYLDEGLVSYAVRYWGEHARRHSEQSEKSSAIVHATALLCDEAQRQRLVAFMWSHGMLKTDLNVTGLHIAATLGLTVLTKALLAKHYEIDATDGWGRTALLIALRSGHEDSEKVVNLLLDAGAFVDLTELSGQNVLILAAEKDYENLGSRILSEAGADNLDWGKNPHVALLGAVYHGQDSRVMEILEKSNLKLKGEDKEFAVTALMLGVERGNYEVVSTLIKHGINVNASGGYRAARPALHRAAGRGHMKLIRLLCKNKADVSSEDPEGRTAWAYSMILCQREVSQYLLNAGPDPKTKRERMNNELHVAARRGSIGDVRFLLESGVNPSIATDDGRTPLHKAFGHYSIVKLLLQYGANPSPLSNTGSTPLDIANRFRQLEVIKLLKKAGAKPGMISKFPLYPSS